MIALKQLSFLTQNITYSQFTFYLDWILELGFSFAIKSKCNKLVFRKLRFIKATHKLFIKILRDNYIFIVSLFLMIQVGYI